MYSNFKKLVKNKAPSEEIKRAFYCIALIDMLNKLLCDELCEDVDIEDCYRYIVNESVLSNNDITDIHEYMCNITKFQQEYENDIINDFKIEFTLINTRHELDELLAKYIDIGANDRIYYESLLELCDKIKPYVNESYDCECLYWNIKDLCL